MKTKHTFTIRMTAEQAVAVDGSGDGLGYACDCDCDGSYTRESIIEAVEACDAELLQSC